MTAGIMLHLVQVLKNHLRLMHGSMILDRIRTRFLDGDLYAERLIREYIWLVDIWHVWSVAYA